MTKMNIAYNVGVIILAIVSVVMAIADLFGMPIASRPWFYPFDYSILIVFAIDYVVRFVKSEHKSDFFKQNIFDLIAIIPFSVLFSFFRFFRVFRILRIAKIAKLSKLTLLVGVSMRLKRRVNAFLHTNGLIYMIYLNIVCVLLGAVGIYITENGVTVHNFGDAVWWSFVTATTVGYGDISPSTGAGRIIAAILMICGIGFISMLTGTVATYFTARVNRTQKMAKLDELKTVTDSLTMDQIDTLIEQAKTIQMKESSAPPILR